MPQLIALALIGAGAYVGYKYITRQMQRVADKPGARNDAAVSDTPEHRGELVWDAEAGVYKPREG